MARAPGEAGRDDAGNTESDLRSDFNDLRSELLGHRMKLVDWWLVVIAMILTLLVIAAPIVGYLGIERFRDIEAEARGNVDRTRKLADEIKELADEIEKMHGVVSSRLKEVTAETAAVKPDKADEAVRSVQADPAASLIDRAVSAAILLQRQGNIEEAIEKWRAVANIVDGTDNELGPRAWFSIGYLHSKESRFREAIDAYNKAIHLKPDHTRAHYNRGIRRFNLGHKDEARRDFERARTLARAAGDEVIADRANRLIERHFGGGDP